MIRLLPALIILACVVLLTSSRKAPGVACDPYAVKCPACVDCSGCKACVKEKNRCSVCRFK